MTLPLFDAPELTGLVGLLLKAGTSKAHTGHVEVRHGGWMHSFRLLPPDVEAFEHQRVSVPDDAIWDAYMRRKGVQLGD